MKTVSIKIKPLTDSENFLMPIQSTKHAAGFDCFYQGKGNIRLSVGCRALIPLDFSMEIPEGFEAQLRPRSGMAKKHGITVLNSPGTIDSDYTGPVGAILINHNYDVDLNGGIFSDFDNDYVIKPGDRICQIVITEVPKVTLEKVEEIKETERGDGGFGSTGR